MSVTAYRYQGETKYLTARDVRALADRHKHHGGPGGSVLAAHIGILGVDGRIYCVGCHWCCPEPNEED